MVSGITGSGADGSQVTVNTLVLERFQMVLKLSEKRQRIPGV